MSGLHGICFSISMVLVTGSTGYLGSTIVNKLRSAKVKFVSVARNSSGKQDVEVCDLTNKNETKNLLERVVPSKIIHCAAAVPKELNGVVNRYESTDASENSLEMALNIAEATTCPIVFISSMAVYDNGALSEGVAYEDETVHKPSTSYALSKFTAEQEMKALTNSGLITLRLPGLFGKPRVTGVLYRAAHAFLLGNEFKLTSAPLWAAMHIDDAADSCIKSLEISVFPKSEIINIGYSGTFNIVVAIKLLADICGVKWGGCSLSAPNFQANLAKSKKYMLYQKIDFRVRLEELVQDVRNDIVSGQF